MRRLILLGFVLLAGAGLYVASPLRAAWAIREAIKTGDSASIKDKVLWPQVRASLRASISKNAQLLPAATSAGAAVTPTLWQRVKWTFGTSMLDRFVETYVTPEGLPKLYAYNRSWNTKVKGRVDEAALPTTERLSRFYARIARAEFRSLTSFEIDLRDKYSPARRIVALLELHRFTWKLASLRVVGSAAPEPSKPAMLPVIYRPDGRQTLATR